MFGSQLKSKIGKKSTHFDSSEPYYDHSPSFIKPSVSQHLSGADFLFGQIWLIIAQKLFIHDETGYSDLELSS